MTASLLSFSKYCENKQRNFPKNKLKCLHSKVIETHLPLKRKKVLQRKEKDFERNSFEIDHRLNNQPIHLFL